MATESQSAEPAVETRRVQAKRRWVRRATISLLSLFAVIQLGVFINNQVRVCRLKQFALRNDSVISAIHKYQGVHGKVPPDLKALVPRFLADLPPSDTGICKSTVYVPWEVKELVGDAGNPWMLVAYCRTLSVDQFVYLPNQKYPKNFERIGDWGYHRG
jgi:hypothetical protein